MERLTFRTGKNVFIRKPHVACSANRPVSERLFCVNCSGPQDRKKCLPLMVIDRLAAYEDTGLSPEEIKALIKPSNDSLTLDELREMDGEPVYVRYLDGAGEFGLVETYGFEYAEIRFRNGVSTVGGKHGLFSRGAEIYRRKPEGDAK